MENHLTSNKQDSTKESREIKRLQNESYKVCYEQAYAESGRKSTQSEVALKAMTYRRFQGDGDND